MLGLPTHPTIDFANTVPDDVEIDADRRARIKKNHSATHLLHLALREVLGDHVQQKGSLVAPDRLRFDFSHFEPMTFEQLEAVEARVNTMVLENVDTEVQTSSIEEAKTRGAMMLFGEKYADTVRMVRIGSRSLELCGGTHVERSGDIGLFKILSESAVAAGVRRIEAATGPGALMFVQSQERLLKRVYAQLKAQPDDVVDRIDRLLKRTKDLEKELDRTKAELALRGEGPSGTDAVEEIAGIRVLFKRADGTPKNALRDLADRLRDQLKSGVVVLTAAEDDRASMLVAATSDVTGKVHAGNVVRAAMSRIGGSGGGKADFAQGGGPADRLDEGIAEARRVLAS
ncbi:MAG: hypothetical protein HC923_11950 [Myxococcales bacterium]|nr:hypothetical protein [Myxococcales bacterium]